jgi:hypothetical protein
VVRLRGRAEPGDFVQARITGAGTYDLEGTVSAPIVDTISARS